MIGDKHMALTKVSNNMVNGAYINALDYGADPTGLLDSSPSIQAAIDAGITTGQTVYIPAGDYLIGTMLGFVHSAQIKMEYGTTLNYSGVDSCIWVRDESGGSENGQGFLIQGGHITGGGGSGIRVGRLSTISPAVGSIRDVKISTMSIGFDFLSGQIIDVRDCNASYNETGFILNNTVGIYHTTVEFNNCRFNGNTFQGGYIIQGWQVTIKNCQFEINEREGLKVLKDSSQGIHQIAFEDCWFEANNQGRAGTGYGQLEITNSFGGALDYISIKNTNFAIPGTSNYQILINGNVSPIVLSNNRYVDGVGPTNHGSITGAGVGQAIFLSGQENYSDWVLDTNATSGFNIGSINTAHSSEIDLNTGITTSLIEYFPKAATLLSCTVVYSGATSSGLSSFYAEIGKRSDQDYYGTKQLASLAPLWGIGPVVLSQRDITATDVVTLYKPDTTGTSGKMCVQIEYWINT
tara:strand:- start:355 stop:1749 length:1395 start_codon:yes stop_codon:yes gene_type:complete